MSRFAAIAKGTRATKPVTLPIWGKDETVAVRPLTALELGGVLAAARAYAIAKGVPQPKEGDRLYDLGFMATTLLVGCVDVDAPTEPYFDSAEQVLENLDADRIALLFEHQQAWQDECSPRQVGMTGDQFIRKTLELAGWESGDQDPLAHTQPSTRLSYTATLAKQYVTLLGDKSRSSSDSEPKATVS